MFLFRFDLHNAQIGFVEIEAAAVVAVEPLVAAAAQSENSGPPHQFVLESLAELTVPTS